MGSGLTGSLPLYIHYIIYYMYISLANKIVVVVNQSISHYYARRQHRNTERRG